MKLMGDLKKEAQEVKAQGKKHDLYVGRNFI